MAGGSLGSLSVQALFPCVCGRIVTQFRYAGVNSLDACAYRFKAFKAPLMPSLTPTPAGRAFTAACASRSL